MLRHLGTSGTARNTGDGLRLGDVDSITHSRHRARVRATEPLNVGLGLSLCGDGLKPDQGRRKTMKTKHQPISGVTEEKLRPLSFAG
jgi:hypothetical protein